MRPPGLRLRLVAVSTTLTAAISAVLLWLGWLLVGGVVSAVPRLPDGTTVRVGEVDVAAEQLSQALGDAARSEVLRAGLIAFPLVVAAAAVLSWLIAGQVLRPLRQVSATARRLSAESLGERIGLRGRRDELAELAAVFDAMLDRLQGAFDAQRRFAANASHELRTPLSVIRTEIDVTLADPAADAAELRRMAGVVRDATRRADQLIAGLLLLARSDSGPVGTHPVDLAELVVPTLAAVRSQAASRRLRMHVEACAAPTVGDPALLERVVGNLMENAVRHNVEGGWIEVATGGGPRATVELRVASSGEVVVPELVEELFEPFRRDLPDRTAGTSGTAGVGLGLSIVRAVVTAHAGTVYGEPVAGGGLAVTVRLPAS